MSTSWGTREVDTVEAHGAGASGRAASGVRSGAGRPGGAGRPAASGRTGGRAGGSGRTGRAAGSPRTNRTGRTGAGAGGSLRTKGSPRTKGGAHAGGDTGRAAGSARSSGSNAGVNAGSPRMNGGAHAGTGDGRAAGPARSNGTGDGRAAGPARSNGTGEPGASNGNASSPNASGASSPSARADTTGPARANGHGVAPPRGRRAKAKPTGPSRQIVAGLDVGGTKTLAVAAGAAGAIIATVRRPTVSGSREKILRSTTEALVELGEVVGCGVDGFAAVGVGIPGLVDVNAGTVRHAVNLGLGSSPLMLADRLGEAAGAPVVVDNDVNVAAIGAAAALGCRDLAYLSVGTGIAAGLLLGGRLRRGARGAAGEIGHLPVDPDGPRCDCGQRGCLEAVASGPALARRWPPGDGASSVTSALLDAAAAGDGTAIAVRDAVAGHLADAVAMLAQTVDPDLVVLGGGVAEAGDPLLDAVVRALAERADRSPVVAALDLTDRVALVPDGVPVGALGAALAARRQVMTRLDAVAGPAFEVREAM